MARSDYNLSVPLAESIEDAILFGHIREVDDMLKLLELDADFPTELRYGLESLRYFRSHYGKNGFVEPATRIGKQKVLLIENAWAQNFLTA